MSVSIVHSPRHLAQTGNTPEAAKWASVTETNLQTVKFIRGRSPLSGVETSEHYPRALDRVEAGEWFILHRHSRSEQPQR